MELKLQPVLIDVFKVTHEFASLIVKREVEVEIAARISCVQILQLFPNALLDYLAGIFKNVGTEEFWWNVYLLAVKICLDSAFNISTTHQRNNRLAEMYASEQDASTLA